MSSTGSTARWMIERSMKKERKEDTMKMKRWLAAFLPFVFLTVAAVEAAPHVSPNIYEWVQSSARANYFFNKRVMHYGIDKQDTGKKVFGVYKHHLCVEHERLFRGFDDEFYVPHSRHTEMKKADIERVPELTILAESESRAGVYAIANIEKRQFFITGHAEYDPLSLKQEYDRDVAAGLPIEIPQNYYPADDPTRMPVVRWRSVANLLFANWLNYYVYQETPYELDGLYRAADD